MWSGVLISKLFLKIELNPRLPEDWNVSGVVKQATSIKYGGL